MGRAGFEQSGLETSKTPIPKNSGAKSGALSAEKLEIPPDLTFLIAHWPDLPEHIQRQIMDMVQPHVENNTNE